MFWIVSSLYRLAAAGGSAFLYHWTWKNMSTGLWYSQLRFLTMLNLFAQAVVYVLALLLSLFRMHRIQASLASCALACSLLVCMLFWGLTMNDPKLVFPPEFSNKTMPAWWPHATHSAPVAANVLELILARPGDKPKMTLVFFICACFGSGYIGYTEYLITKLKTNTYPLFKTMTQDDRYKFYGACMGIFIVLALISSIIVRMVSKTPGKQGKKKSGKQSQNNNSAVTSGDKNAAANKKNKARKQD